MIERESKRRYFKRMKNYYEILEVDIHASSEVIDKAFKVLAKKYHPDTQELDKKEWAEEQFKLLNEAYEVLSDVTKRDEYTKELEFDKNRQLEALMLKNANLEVQVEDLQSELEALRHSSTNPSSFDNSNYHQPQYQNQAYRQNFYNPNSPPQYTVHEQTYSEEPVYYESYYHPIKSKLKSFLAFCITLAIIVLIGFILWKIPYTHNMFVRLYENNSIVKSIIDLFYQ